MVIYYHCGSGVATANKSSQIHPSSPLSTTMMCAQVSLSITTESGSNCTSVPLSSVVMRRPSKPGSSRKKAPPLSSLAAMRAYTGSGVGETVKVRVGVRVGVSEGVGVSLVGMGVRV